MSLLSKALAAATAVAVLQSVAAVAQVAVAVKTIGGKA